MKVFIDKILGKARDSELPSSSSALLKNNWSAIDAPTQFDDEIEGYNVGSKWVDIVNNEVYICTNPTEDHAEWQKSTATLAEEIIHIPYNFITGTNVQLAIKQLVDYINLIIHPIAKENIDIDDGQTEEIDSFPITDGDSCTWDYVIQNGNKKRAGIITCTWNNNGNISFNDMSTNGIPITTDTNVVHLTPIINGTDVQLNASVDVGGGNNWSIKVLRQIII